MGVPGATDMTRRPRRPGLNGGLAAVFAMLALAISACGSSGPPTGPSAHSPASATAAPSATPTASPTGPDPVVIDTDLSSDDTMAIPFLLREPSLDVLAVTVVGTGLVHCGAGLQAVTNILATLGIDDVPVSCGRSEPLAGTHAFPAEWRAAADDSFGLTLERRSVSAPDIDAPELIRSVAGSAARPITIVALGPLTNIAEALQGDAALARRIERIVAMGGAIDVPGNVALGAPNDPPLPAEWNVYADPTATDIVLRSGVPITLVPLDATNHLPLNAAFVAALEADHAAAPADIAYELLMKHGVAPGEFFWDQLASVISVDESVATFETVRLSVDTTEGPDSGRTARAADGVAVRVAMTADQAAFEARFLAGLRIGPPRPHQFDTAGSFAVRFDGTNCIDDAPESLAAGDWNVAVETSVAGTTAFIVARFHDGAGWDELLEYFRTAADPTNQPSFLDVAAYSIFEAPGSGGLIAPVTPGSYGVICLHITKAANRAFAGSPFRVVP
jgi:inosine-uridine nucleoside N-ribohydrolase